MEPTRDIRLAERVRSAQALLERGYGREEVWLSLLKRWVLGQNAPGRFADILEHPHFCSVDAAPTDALAAASVAEMSVVHEFLLAAGDMAAKRRQGQFYTPDDVAIFMAKQTEGFPEGMWLDPCCGIGNLTYWLVHRQANPEMFLRDHVKCSDLSDEALFSARVILSVAFQRQVRNLFTQIAPRFVSNDYLAGGPTHTPRELQHDFVLMNPPYVGVHSDLHPAFEAAGSRDLYALFMEKSLRTASGVVAITPQSFTHGARHRALRRVLLREAASVRVYCFDNVPDNVFKGFKFGSENSNSVNSTRAAVTVVDPGSAERDVSAFRITPLIRWAARERSMMFDRADRLLADPAIVTDAVLPKVYKGLELLHREMVDWSPTLGEVIARSNGGGTRLNVPTTPRYFISAARRELSRSSMTSFDVPNAELRRVYLTLNSSLTYLWWRIHDGGMTLSKSTLLSVPLPPDVDFDSQAARSLECELLESESDNLVFKLNSGKDNENVKHPLDLIHRLNCLLAPAYASRLIEIHANSLIPGVARLVDDGHVVRSDHGSRASIGRKRASVPSGLSQAS